MLPTVQLQLPVPLRAPMEVGGVGVAAAALATPTPAPGCACALVRFGLVGRCLSAQPQSPTRRPPARSYFDFRVRSDSNSSCLLPQASHFQLGYSSSAVRRPHPHT